MPTGTHRVRPGGLLAIGTALLAACGRSAEAKAHDAVKQLESWDSTMALLDRVRPAVPDEFASQVRQAAAESRPQAEAKLREARAP